MTALSSTADLPAGSATNPADARAIGRWLAVVAAMIFAMIVLGALTRLTESGLSMVEWRPVTGWLPPLSEAAWQAELAKYAQSPQGRLVNQGITVAQFKEIFWLEYLHRLWGRLIGLAFALPMLWFFVRGRVPGWLKPRLVALLFLGGLQGAVGWIMVASGLQDLPAVSHYKLALHLVLAVGLYAYILWLAIGLLQRDASAAAPADRRIGRATDGLIALLFVVLTFGAFVAGLRAGQVHTTFPTMSGYWVPPGLLELSPAWLNFVATQTGTQFAHRWLAKLLVVLCIALWLWTHRANASPPVRRAATMMAAMTTIQLGLGIATILTGAQIALATLHQAGAVLLVSSLVLVLRRTRPAQMARPGAVGGTAVRLASVAAALFWAMSHQPEAAAAAPPSADSPPRTGPIADEPLDLVQRRADAGETDAMEELARRYIEGAGVKADAVEGAKWLQRAAERGAPGAMFNIGVMYERGLVLERDPARALEWYAKASAAGVAMATHNMALMYREGTGVPPDSRRAHELLLRAARQGMGASMFVLGSMSEAGSHGRQKDLVEAIVWYAMVVQFQRLNPGTGSADLARRAGEKVRELQQVLSAAEMAQAQSIGEREYRLIADTMRATARPPDERTARATPPAPEPPPATAREQFVEIQKLLLGMRLYTGRPDGLMGPLTRKAILAFQRQAGLPQTGEPSPELLDRLRKQAAPKPKR